VAERELRGVTWGAVVRRADSRGSFRELWREDTFGPLDPRATGSPPGARPRFVQANLSTSAAGVLRGLHVHRRQLDLWIVASGRAFVALVDVREALAGRRDRGTEPPAIETRSVGPDTTLTIPAGVAHGFLAIEPLELVYLVTNAYDGSDELGFAWDDPAVGVPWPLIEGTPGGRPILSDRDRANPSLAELLARQSR
jgi:dTDP-4-dehydrorhamnose 3,5-epimerase